MICTFFSAQGTSTNGSKIHYGAEKAKSRPSFGAGKLWFMWPETEVFYKKGALKYFANIKAKGGFKNFAKFTGKHLCQSLFFNKVAGLSLQLY